MSLKCTTSGANRDIPGQNEMCRLSGRHVADILGVRAIVSTFLEDLICPREPLVPDHECGKVAKNTKKSIFLALDRQNMWMQHGGLLHVSRAIL